MNKSEITALQHALNHFTTKYLKYVTQLRVDGAYGQATKKRVQFVKYYLGYPVKERNSQAGAELRWRLRHPKRPNWKWARPARLAMAAKRRIYQRRHAKKSQVLHGKGFGTFDGRPVAAWMVRWLQKSRDHRCPHHPHGWQGFVVSGIRTPSHSEHLCFVMCGRPSCPGRCAGRASNHNMLPTQGEFHGAVDVTFYEDFAQIQREIGSPLRNALPNDRVHFSQSGR